MVCLREIAFCRQIREKFLQYCFPRRFGCAIFPAVGDLDVSFCIKRRNKCVHSRLFFFIFACDVFVTGLCFECRDIALFDAAYISDVYSKHAIGLIRG